MCEPITLLGLAAATGAASGYYLGKKREKNYKKAVKQTNSAIDSINQDAMDRVAHNELANTTQSTDELTNSTLANKLITQKVPLNTTTTGATVGSPASVGLNLGGY